MRFLLIPVLMMWFALIAPMAAHADQNDPRLDGLFEELAKAKSTSAAAKIEQQIWSIWVQRDNSRVDSHMALGIKAMRTGALKLSLREFTRVVTLDPEFAEGWNKRATVHYMMGNLEQSVADIQRTLALEPRHYGAISGMGLIFDATDNVEGALKAWQQVLEFTPFNEQIQKHVEDLKVKLDGKPI